MLRKFSIRTKLILVAAVPLVALAVLIALGLPAFQLVKVGGPEYDKIQSNKDLVADILPPPAYLVEFHLTVNELALRGSAAFIDKTAVDAGVIEGLVAEAAQLETGYKERLDYWRKTLAPGEIADALLVDSHNPALEYLKVVKDEFVPAVRAQNFDQVNNLVVGKLDPLFDEHKAAIEHTVELTQATTLATEKSVADEISRRFSLLAIAVGLAILATAAIGFLVSRAIGRPVRLLTDAATRAATTGLPLIVSEIQTAEADADVPVPERFVVESEDELAELATALNAMQGTAVDLAVGQARARRTVAENLSSLGRRNQSMLSRTLSFISTLEQDERNPATLSNLFRLDHLVTRIRRNAESLLVLAGNVPSRPYSEPIDLGDVVRAALSQIEGYDRVSYDDLDSAKVQGAAADDVSHVLAELLENATNYSPPGSSVQVRGRLRSDGYVVSIADEGIGMNAEAIAAANERVGSVHDFDQTPSRVLGHLVVGSLTARHGIGVKLAETATGTGVTVSVTLPISLLEGVAAPAERADSAPAIRPGRRAAAAAPERVRETPVRRLPSSPEPASALLARTTINGSADPKAASKAEAAGTVSESKPVSKTQGGLSRRVRGAQMPDTGAASLPAARPADPVEVRSALSAIQRGVQKGREDAGTSPTEPNEAP